MALDTELAQLGQRRIVRPTGAGGHLALGGVHGDLVVVDRPGVVVLGHDPCAGRVLGRRHRHGAAQPGLARHREGGLEAGRAHLGALLCHAVAGVPGVLPAFVLGRGLRAGKQRVEFRSVPLHRVQQLAEPVTRVVGPGQARRAEEEQAQREPYAGRGVPAAGTPHSAGSAVGQQHAARGLRPLAPAAADPQDEATGNEHPEPARGDLRVETAELAQVQVAVQVVEPGGEGRRPPPGGELALDLRRVGVDEDRALLLPELGHGQHDPRGVLRPGRGDDGGEGALRVGAAGGGDLLRQRERRLADLLDAQLVAVDGLVELRSEGVREPGQGGDEQERCDEHPGVEVQPDEEGPYALPGAPGRSGVGGGRGRRSVRCRNRHVFNHRTVRGSRPGKGRVS